MRRREYDDAVMTHASIPKQERKSKICFSVRYMRGARVEHATHEKRLDPEVNLILAFAACSDYLTSSP